MQLVSFAVQHYVSLPYQKFTEKIIAALAIFQVIQRAKENEGFEYDELELAWIEQNTHEDLCIPIYILDRCVNPTKGEFKPSHNKITFDTNIPDVDNPEVPKQVTLTENQIQNYLCMAIRRVNDIVMKSVKAYSEEIPIPDLGEIKQEQGLSFESV